jgi:hypothetical protein
LGQINSAVDENFSLLEGTGRHIINVISFPDCGVSRASCFLDQPSKARFLPVFEGSFKEFTTIKPHDD